MCRRIRCLFLVPILVTFSSTATAGDYLEVGKVTFMQNAYGGWLIRTEGATSNPDNCSKDTVILEGAHSQYKEIYSFLLSSYMANRKVRLYVNGCHSAGYMKLSFLYSSGDWS